MSTKKSRSSSSSRRGAAAAASLSRSGRDRADPSWLPDELSPLSRRSQYDTPRPVPKVFTSRGALLPDDRRTFKPQPPSRLRVRARAIAPAMTFSGLPARVVATPSRKSLQTPSKRRRGPSPAALLFNAPSRVAVCVQRGRRKEVIHALGIAGRRVSRGKRGPFSSVRCK